MTSVVRPYPGSRWSRSLRSAIAVGVLLVSSAWAQDRPSGMRLRTLQPGVHLISGYANGNMLVVETDSGLVLVDAQSAKRVEAADTALRTVTQARVRYVVFTHYHEDHTGGMVHWRESGAQAVAHRAVPAQMEKDTIIVEMGNWHRERAIPEAFPDHTFEDSVTIRSAGVEAHLYHVAAAHTDGDVVVWFPGENVLHVGDLIEPEGALFIDWWAGGTLDGIIAATEWLLARTDDATTIVPGHGRTIDRATVEYHHRMLIHLRDRVMASLSRSEPRDVLLAAKPAAEYEAFLGGETGADRVIRLLHYGLSRRPR